MEMDQDQLQTKVRTLKKRVEEHSETIERIVESIISKYNRDQDRFIQKVKSLLDRADELSDAEIESIIIRIPINMYFASNGLETLGMEGDTAKAQRMEIFNNAFMEIEGTIPDKTKYAELKSFPEFLVEAAYTRAYKKLKTQIENAEHIFSGAKKLLSKRMLDIELSMRDPNTSTHRRSRLDDD